MNQKIMDIYIDLLPKIDRATGYLAIDSDNSLYWYEEKPVFPGRHTWQFTGHNNAYITTIETLDNIDYSKTLVSVEDVIKNNSMHIMDFYVKEVLPKFQRTDGYIAIDDDNYAFWYSKAPAFDDGVWFEDGLTSAKFVALYLDTTTTNYEKSLKTVAEIIAYSKLSETEKIEYKIKECEFMEDFNWKTFYSNTIALDQYLNEYIMVTADGTMYVVSTKPDYYANGRFHFTSVSTANFCVQTIGNYADILPNEMRMNKWYASCYYIGDTFSSIRHIPVPKQVINDRYELIQFTDGNVVTIGIISQEELNKFSETWSGDWHRIINTEDSIVFLMLDSIRYTAKRVLDE